VKQPAIVREYHELLMAIDARRRELGMPMIELDERAGLPLGYVGKLLTDPTKRNAKTLGRTSLGLVMKALGVEIVVMHAAGAHASEPQASQGVAATTVHERMKNLASNGAIKLNARFTPEQMSRRMRQRARLRWAKVREEKRRQKAREARRLEQEAKEQRRAERAAQAAAEAAQQVQEGNAVSPAP